MTWEALDAARPSLQVGSRSTAAHIRASLYAVGNLLATQDQLEPRERYLARRAWRSAIEQAPEGLRVMLHQHVAWLQRRSLRPRRS